jgi:phosphinothricin acetyltransferase
MGAASAVWDILAMEVEIRLAGPDRDAAAVAAIYGAAVEHTLASFEVVPPDAAEIAGRMRTVLARTPWLVAVADDEVVGYAYAAIHRERAGYRWSVDVSAYVHEDHRGRRIGRSLYDRLIPLLRRQGFANAYAGIALPNPASVALHEAIGMRLIGVYQRVGWKAGDWLDVAWYGMRLGEPQLSASGEPVEPISLAEALDAVAAD